MIHNQQHNIFNKLNFLAIKGVLLISSIILLYFFLYMPQISADPIVFAMMQSWMATLCIVPLVIGIGIFFIGGAMEKLFSENENNFDNSQLSKQTKPSIESLLYTFGSILFTFSAVFGVLCLVTLMIG